METHRTFISILTWLQINFLSNISRFSLHISHRAKQKLLQIKCIQEGARRATRPILVLNIKRTFGDDFTTTGWHFAVTEQVRSYAYLRLLKQTASAATGASQCGTNSAIHSSGGTFITKSEHRSEFIFQRKGLHRWYNIAVPIRGSHTNL